MPILGDMARAIGQFLDPRFLGVLIKAVGLTILLLIGLCVALVAVLEAILPGSISLPVIGTITGFNAMASLAAIPVFLVASVFVMFPVAALFIGLFLDEIANAVEARHYPHLRPVGSLPLATALKEAAKFAAVFLLANGVALVIYLLVAPLAPVIFWLVNGYLIGREYFSMVAMRRMPPTEATHLRRTYRMRVWMAGILMAVPLSIPVLNLMVPILGVATFTHQVERLRHRAP